MASSVLLMIKEEVTCPICLELLKEPVSADCDHSFCRACITLNYESSKVKEGVGICPVCRLTYLFENLRPNRHVTNIVERLKEFKSSPEEEQKVHVCAQHGEKLQLFCEKDMVAICWLCERSQDHLGHQTALLEEVAYKYEDQIHSEEENVQMEFKGLQEFLDSTKKNELQKLMQEKEDIMNSLSESQNELVKQREAVRDLISDVEHQLQCSTMEMLQGVNSVLKRSQTLRVILPTMVPRKQRRVFRAPDVKGMLQVFQGLMDAQRYWVHVTLRQVQNKNVVINMEKRQIHQYGHRRNLQDYETYDLGVLGIPAIQSGKCYWEVDVSRSDNWLLGLNDGKCAQPKLHSQNKKGIKVKQNFGVKQHGNYQPNLCNSFKFYGDYEQDYYQPQYEIKDNSDAGQHVNYQPKHGYWVIGKRNRSGYNAFEECSVTHNASVLVLSLIPPPSRVGVFLDREACTLSFYDVSNHGALIYKFYEPSFPKSVYPYFNPMESSEPMTVCGPPS
ncbi:tripartite motif-containing protein 30A isoform X2 [Phodopus roborovskii]|uniref:tripartite motif-containing protein 30A isoform X2 n=1 Tax=Phodopus roborovskii TaxID=109678 RepID=UPI0021E496E0|nr:tripartite motif-containing protein 30A isoform X2 [Phodopus roborovskii]